MTDPAPDPGATTQRLPTVEPEASGPYEPAPREPGPPARRFWSARRIPAGLTALLLLAATGLVLYDTAAVRLGRDAMAWRKRLADELATRSLDDVWVIVGAAVAAVLGLWLTVLALTPGLRSLLPMRRTAGVRAGLERRAAGLILRDRAMQVPGVRSARVQVGRRRIGVWAEVAFRETDQVRADLDVALADAVRQLGLAREPRPELRVRRTERE